jgi:hypothetical protein
MLETSIADEQAWTAFLGDVEKHGAFMARPTDATRLQQFSSVEVSLRGPSGEIARVTAQVVQVTPTGDAALLVAAEERARILTLKLEPALKLDAQTPEPKEAWTRYEELSKIEKIKLARTGNPDDRRRILKDRDQSLHAFVLENPGLTGAELVPLIRAGIAGGALIKRISEHSGLTSQPAIAEALVQSPNTPLPAAVQLVAKIPIETARRIGKAGNLRPQIVQAARKRVMGG